MDDPRSQEEATGSDLSSGSFYASQRHVSARHARFHAVVYVFHMAKFEERLDGILHRADSNRRQRIFQTKPLAEHTRYSS